MTLKVRIDVDRNAAIKAGSTRFGRLDVDLTDADLATLTPEEREELTRLPTNDGVLIGYYACEKNPGYNPDHQWTVLTADLAGVRAALGLHRQHRTLIAEEVAQRERETAAKRAEAIAAALTAPVEDLIVQRNSWNARRIRATRQDFRAFAIAGHAGPIVARAAGDGYSVTAEVIDAVANQLPTANEISEPDDDYEWEERAFPSESAYRLLDTLTGAVQAVQHKPDCVSLTVSRIVRITEPQPEYGEEGAKRTGVVVTISSPITADRYLLYYAE